MNTNVELTGQTLASTELVTNGTYTVIAAANYTVASCNRPSDGMKGICYKALGIGVPAANDTVKVSYTYYPNGYIDDAGGRSMAGLIAIFTALAIAIVALVPALRSGVLDMVRG